MHEFLIIENKKYLSTKLAAKIAGYTSDYVGQLYRLGKVEGKMVGRSLYVTEASLIAHKLKTSPAAVIKGVSSTNPESLKAQPNTSTVTSRVSNESVFPSLQKTSVLRGATMTPAINTVLASNLTSHFASNNIVSNHISAQASTTTSSSSSHTSLKKSQKLNSQEVQLPNNLDTKSGFVPKFKHRKIGYSHISKVALQQLVAVALVVSFITSSLYIPGAAPIKNALESASTEIADTLNTTTSVYGDIAEHALQNTTGLASVWSGAKKILPHPISSFTEKVGHSLFAFFFADEDTVTSPTPSAATSSQEAANILTLATNSGNSYNVSPVTQIKYATTTVYNDPTIVIKGITEDVLNQKLSEFKSDLLAHDYAELQHTFDSIARMNLSSNSGGNSGGGSAITSTDGLTITNSTFSGSTGNFTGNVTAGSLTVTGAATVGDTLSAGSTTLTNLTVSNTSTSTFTGGLSSGNLLVNGNVQIAGLLNCDTIDTDGAGNLMCGTDAGAGGGISSLNGLNTAAQVFATSSDTNIGLTISSSGSTHTFTTTWSGTLAASRGGTGLGSVVANELLIGNPGGTGWTQLATSSLGLLTTDVTEGSNLYFTNARADARAIAVLAGTTTLPNLTTLTNLANASSTLFTAGTLFATNIISSGSTTLQNFTALNSTTTNATSTNLYASNATIGNLTTTGDLALGNFHVDATPTCGNTYHTFIGNVGSVGGDECAALNVTQADTNGNIIYRFGPTTASWAGEFYANASLVGMNTKTVVPLTFAINGLEKMRIDSTGNVGVGTTSPSRKLSVAGSAVVTGDVLASSFNATSSTGYQFSGATVLTASTTADNLSIGLNAGTALASGAIRNVFVGSQAGQNTTTGIDNVGTGFRALLHNTTGSYNSAFGGPAMTFNTTGSSNTAVGFAALAFNDSGSFNTSVGMNSLSVNTSGSSSTAVGYNAGLANTTGTFNTYIGFNAGYSDGVVNTGATLTNTTALGYNAQVTASNSLILGGTGAYGVNVGIGTTSPYAALSVNGNAAFSGDIRATNITATGTISAQSLTLNGSATSTAAGGFNITAGCFAINGICLGSGAGTVNSGTAGQFAYYAADGTTVSGTSTIFVASNGNMGIGTTSPYAKLSVVGQIVADYFTATSTTATSTFAGGLNVGNGAIVYDSTSGVTTINSLNTGPMSFDTDAGAVTWIDMPVTSASVAGTVERYTAALNGNPMLSIAGLSDGAGGVTSLGVGIGTTSPSAKLTVWGDGTGIGQTFAVVNSASTTNFSVQDNGTAYVAGNLGIGTSSPYTKLSVAGNIDAQAYYSNGQLLATATGTRNYYLAGATTSVSLLTGTDNIFMGYASGVSNTSGTNNTAVGADALHANTTGLYNTASGANALIFNTTGSYNSAAGQSSMFFNTTGSNNTASGYSSLFFNQTGSALTAIGNGALYSNQAASSTALGYNAGYTNSSGTYNLFLGYGADASVGTLTNAIAIGANAIVGASNSLVLGNGTNVGIGTSSPYAKLSVAGQIVADYITATSTTATSTIAGGLNVGNGSLVYDSSSGITSISGLEAGALNFDSDAGNISWVDMPVTSTSVAGLSNSYTAQLDGNPMISVYGLSDGAGGVINTAVGIGTTSPNAKLTVWGNGTTTGQTFAVINSASTTNFSVQDNGTAYFGGNVGIGSTSPFATFAINPTAGQAANQFVVGSSTATAFVINNSGNVGIGTTNPVSSLSVNGGISLGSYASTANAGTGVLIASGGIGIGYSTPGTGRLSVNGNVGVGTTTPYSKLSVWGSGTGANRLFELTDSASSTLVAVQENGTAYFKGNIGVGTTSPYAALSVAGQVVADYLTATSTTATSSIAGGLNVGNGALVYDSASGITSISSLSTGPLNLDADGGQVSWVDMAVTSASAVGTVEQYTAQLNSNPMLAIYGLSDGAGGITNTAVGIGTTSPQAKLTVWGNGTTTGQAFAVVNSASSTAFTVLDNGNVGVGTSSPFTALSVSGVGFFSGDIQATNITATGTLSAGTSTLKNLIVTNTSTSTFAGGISALNIALTGTGTSTAANGFNITSGCYAINGTCISGGGGDSGTVNSGTAGQFAYYAANGTAVSGTSTIFIAPTGNVGIGTTSPYAKLSVAGTIVGQNFIATSTTATSTFAYNVGISGKLDLHDSNHAVVIGNISGKSSALYALDIQSSGADVNQWFNTGAYSSVIGYANKNNSASSTIVGIDNLIGSTNSTKSSIFGFGNEISGGGFTSLFGANNYSQNSTSSVMLGYGNTYITAPESSIIGYVNNSYSASSTVIGWQSWISSGSVGTTMLGNENYAEHTQNSSILGWSNDLEDGNYNSVIGSLNYALATTSTIIGYRNEVEGDTDILMLGRQNFSQGNNNTSILGYNNDVENSSNSYVIGRQTTLGNSNFGNAFGIENDLENADYSSAFGNYNSVLGSESLASGIYNYVTTASSSAFGYANTVSAASAIAIGSNITNNIANSLMIGPSNTSKLTILSSGNVGIGTSSPYAKLSVAGTIVGQNFIATSTTATSTFAGGLNVAGSSGLSVLQNGKVGIGLTSPSQALEVNGDVKIGTGNAEAHLIFSRTGYNYVTAPSGGTLAFVTNGLVVTDANSNLVLSNTGDSWFNRGNLGVGTTSPYAALSVAGQVVADYLTATSTTATSTIAGGLNVGNGALVYDSSSGVTSIGAFETGAINFDTDAGVVNWTDMALSAAPSGAVESYTANLNGNPMITVFGVSQGSGVIGSLGVGIGTTSPSAKLTVWGNGTTTGQAFAVVNSASSTAFTVLDNGNVGIGTTSPLTALHIMTGGAQVLFDNITVGGGSTAATVPTLTFTNPTITAGPSSWTGSTTFNYNNSGFYIAHNGSSGNGSAPGGFGLGTNGRTNDIFITSAGLVGIGGTTSPYAALSVVGATGVVADHFTATSTSATSTFAAINIFGAGTSTITNNLYVQGTLRSSVSYVGDLVFSNGFRFIESTTSPDRLNLTNGLGTNIFTIDDSGNMGLGTSTPAYKLQVVGDIAANAFVNTSTRDAKHDITYLNDADKMSILDKIRDVKIAQYRYNSENESDPLRLGLIAEEAPSEVLSVSGKGVDIYKLSTFILAGVQELQTKIDTLDARVTSLENALGMASTSLSISASSTEATSTSTLASGTISSFFEALSIKFSATVAEFKDVIANTISAKSVKVEDGITVKDKATGAYYCIVVENGVMKNIAGACGAGDANGTATTTNATGITGAAGGTPVTTPTPVPTPFTIVTGQTFGTSTPIVTPTPVVSASTTQSNPTPSVTPSATPVPLVTPVTTPSATPAPTVSVAPTGAATPTPSVTPSATPVPSSAPVSDATVANN